MKNPSRMTEASESKLAYTYTKYSTRAELSVTEKV